MEGGIGKDWLAGNIFPIRISQSLFVFFAFSRGQVRFSGSRQLRHFLVHFLPRGGLIGRQ